MKQVAASMRETVPPAFVWVKGRIARDAGQSVWPLKYRINALQCEALRRFAPNVCVQFNSFAVCFGRLQFYECASDNHFAGIAHEDRVSVIFALDGARNEGLYRRRSLSPDRRLTCDDALDTMSRTLGAPNGARKLEFFRSEFPVTGKFSLTISHTCCL
jgi:hypothetical protein